MERGAENFSLVAYPLCCRSANKDEPGSYTWKLRDELSAALDKVDLSQVELYAVCSRGGRARLLVAKCKSENLELLLDNCWRGTILYTLQ